MIGAQNSGFVPQITHTDFAESYIRKTGEVEQLSRVGDYERMVSLQEQALQTKPLEYCS